MFFHVRFTMFLIYNYYHNLELFKTKKYNHLGYLQIRRLFFLVISVKMIIRIKFFLTK